MRTTRKRVRVLALAVLAVVAAESAAAAQTTGEGLLGPDYVRAAAADLGAGTFPGRGLPATAPAVESPYVWTRTTTSASCVVFAGPVPPELARSVLPLPGIEELPGSQVKVGAMQGAPPGAVWLDGDASAPADAYVAGRFAVDTATPSDGGTGVLVVPRCVGPAAPELPAAPPSAALIWEQTALPRASVEASPPGTADWPGIVNVESRFWHDPLPDARATVTLDGYVVEVTAHPVAYAWSFGNGAVTVDETPATGDAPARVTFRRRGDYRVELHVVWAGVAHLSAPSLGLDFGLHDLGTVTLRAASNHHVAEIRALLRSRTSAS